MGLRKRLFPDGHKSSPPSKKVKSDSNADAGKKVEKDSKVKKEKLSVPKETKDKDKDSNADAGKKAEDSNTKPQKPDKQPAHQFVCKEK